MTNTSDVTSIGDFLTTTENNDTADSQFALPVNCSNDVTNDPQCNKFLTHFTKFVLLLDLYFTPVIIAVGIVGNVLSFMVFSTTYLRRMSSSVYLAALALSDTFFLITLFCSWIFNFDVNVWNRSGWCQFLVYIAYVTSFLSVWYVVAFTAERYLIVCFPLKRQILCRPRRAKIVVVTFAGVALILYNYSLWTVHVAILGGQPYCIPINDYYYSLVNAINNADTLFTLVIPVESNLFYITPIYGGQTAW